MFLVTLLSFVVAAYIFFRARLKWNESEDNADNEDDDNEKDRKME